MSLITDARRRLWLITGLLAALLVWWATITPPTFGPDEYKHVDLVRAVQQSWRYPAYDDRRVSNQMLEALRTIPFDGNLTQAQATPRDERPTLHDLGNDGPTARRNHIAAHPPAFYVVVAVPLALVSPLLDNLSFDWTFLALRLFSMALLLPLPWLSFAIARRLKLSEPVATAGALLPLVVPNFLFVSATVNNDTLLVTLATAVMLMLVRIATGDTTKRTTLLAGATIGVALLTKFFAWVLLPAALVACLVGPARQRWSRLATIGALALACGGWWFVRNVVVFDHFQPTVGLRPDAPASFQPSWSVWSNEFFPIFVTSYWARFGNAVGEALRISSIGWGVVLVALFAAGYGVIRRRLVKPGVFVLLLVPVVALAAFVAVGSWASYVRADAFGVMKGRYMNAGIAPMMVAVAMGLGLLVNKRRAVLPLAVVIAVVIANAWSLVVVLSHYWGPTGTSIGTRMGAVAAWSPLPAGLLYAVWAVVAAVVVASLRSAYRIAAKG